MNLKLAKESTNSVLLESDNVININGIHKQNLPYIFIWTVYYAWVIVFSTWWTASPFTKNVFDNDLRSLIHSINLISSAVFVFVVRKEWFVKVSRIGAIILIVGMSLFLTVQLSTIQLTSAVVVAVSLGCVNIGILMPFVFALNNTEKLYAVVGSNALINAISLLQEGSTEGYYQSISNLLISFAILAAALSATIFFKESSIVTESYDTDAAAPEIHPRVYLTLVLNCFFAILCKGVSKGIFNITAENFGDSILIWYYAGGLAGCLIYFALYAFTQRAFVWLVNISFAFVAMGLLCNAFAADISGLAAVFAVLLGAGSTVGMINMYYIMGVVGKKYSSMRYLRLSILLIGICGGVSGVVMGNLIQSINAFEVSIIASIVSASIMLLFMVLTPIMAQEHFYTDWVKDSEKVDVDNDQLYLFRKYQLSKREIDVCKLLLQGYTLRQIAAMLSIAYPTVNTYCTGIYRKLNINSRTELLIMFKDYVAR